MIEKDIIKPFLIKKGIRQRVLASNINMHPTRLSSFLNGKLYLSDKYLKKICRDLNISFEEYKKGKIKENK